MRTEGLVLAGISAFFLVITGTYWFTSYEVTGTVLLLLTTGLGAIPGAWILWRARHAPPRPEDQYDADPAAGAGAVGAFPEASIWPLVFALGLALSGVGFVFGVWFALLGVPLAVGALVGGIAESRRGPERPVGAGDAGPERPVGAGDAGPERPVGAGDAGPERPVGAGDAGPGEPEAGGIVSR